MNPYDELGVAPDATLEQINAAFRNKARTAHPDAGGDADTFQRLQRAVALLRDDERRQWYDQTGATDEPQTNDAPARELFLQVVQQVLTQPGLRDVRHIDLIAKVKQTINEALRNVRMNRDNGLAEQRRVADIIGRITRKGDGPNLIAGMLKQQAVHIGNQLAELDRQEAMGVEALALADDYEWRKDEPPPSTARTSIDGLDHGSMRNAFFGTTTTF